MAEQYCKKGSKVYVEGQLQTRKWQDQSGAERYTTEIVLSQFRGELTMLDSRGGGESTATVPRRRAARARVSTVRLPAAPARRFPPAGGGGAGPIDDDIPF